MPRLARLDAPGVLHHLILRGIERRNIFWNDEDREDFLNRLSELLSETGTPCYAWAHIPNHAHFLFRTGKVPLATLMRRLLTGYAVSFVAPEGECENEMFVTIRWERNGLAVPLSRLTPINLTGEQTKQAVQDWHYWVLMGYEFG